MGTWINRYVTKSLVYLFRGPTRENCLSQNYSVYNEGRGIKKINKNEGD